MRAEIELGEPVRIRLTSRKNPEGAIEHTVIIQAHAKNPSRRESHTAIITKDYQEAATTYQSLLERMQS